MLSAFIALSLTPTLCSILLKPTAVHEGAKGLNKFSTNLMSGLKR
jgi:HAE1 family hydrophobic/amphiphilic exporter-1